MSRAVNIRGAIRRLANKKKKIEGEIEDEVLRQEMNSEDNAYVQEELSPKQKKASESKEKRLKDQYKKVGQQIKKLQGRLGKTGGGGMMTPDDVVRRGRRSLFRQE